MVLGVGANSNFGRFPSKFCIIVERVEGKFIATVYAYPVWPSILLKRKRNERRRQRLGGVWWCHWNGDVHSRDTQRYRQDRDWHLKTHRAQDDEFGEGGSSISGDWDLLFLNTS